MGKWTKGRSSVRACLLTSALFVLGCGDDGGSEPVDIGFNPSSLPDTGVVSAAPDTGVMTAPPAMTKVDAGMQNTPPPVRIPDAGMDSGTQSASADAGDAGSLPSGDGGPAPSGDGGGMVGSDTNCCPDGKCLCHGPGPSALTSARGPFKTATVRASTGTIFYPTDAAPPFAAIAICGGFLNTGPEMEPWGTFYASHGIVTLVTTTGASDDPDLRATKLLASIKELKGLTSGPLMGKLAPDRFGTSGYSMGGGGTTIASSRDKTLKTSVGLAPWSPVGSGITTPTLLLCGGSDTTAPCGSNARSSYNGIPMATPKMMVTISGTSHLQWFGPTTDAQRGAAGKFALAFQKVYLEGDTRWAPLLKSMVSGTTVVTNIQ
jgi:hypothetical protein